MKELQTIVSEQITQMINNGTIEQMIEKRLTETINECVKESMRTYSDFGKAIKEKIEATINHNISNVTLPEYNHFIAQILLESYTEALNENAKDQIKEMLDEHLAPVGKEITAQELVDTIAEYWRDDAICWGGEVIEIEWDRRNEAIEMTIKHPEYSWQNIRVNFYNHGEADTDTYHIGYINEENERVISGCISGATYAMGLVGYFYKLYCARTKITGFDEVYGEDIYVDE